TSPYPSDQAINLPLKTRPDFFRRGLRRNNSVTVSGGGQRSSYYLSVSNLADEGIVPLNRFDRTTIRLTGSGQIASNLKATASLAYSNSGGYRVQQGSNLSGLMLGLLRTPPSFDNSAGYENADGTQRNYRAGGGYDNPYWTINKNPFTDKVNRVFGYTQLEWAPVENVFINYRYGLDTYTDVRKQIIAKYSRTLPQGSITDEMYNVQEQLLGRFQRQPAQPQVCNGLRCWFGYSRLLQHEQRNRPVCL
ncbi:MAG: hypothetical protein EBZ26_06800, partial [Flavobacteriia bacterium]|nr:hypothetical protein [Flavobacteriia bacterium]